MAPKAEGHLAQPNVTFDSHVNRSIRDGGGAWEANRTVDESCYHVVHAKPCERLYEQIGVKSEAAALTTYRNMAELY